MPRRKTNFGCTVDGCATRAVSRGWCNKHYSRWLKYGDVHVQKTAGTGEPEQFLRTVAERPSDECILWPYAKHPRTGYGVFQIERSTTTAHRKQCELAHGAPPSESHEAAHSCGNRLCVNPRHIRWATKLENAADRWDHGTQVHGEDQWASKLTVDQVRAIRRAKAAGIGRKKLAAEFGVSPAHVTRIVRFESWSWLR